MAARRGDVDGLVELAERYERLQAGRSSRGLHHRLVHLRRRPEPVDVPGHERLADRKAYADVLRLLDLNLAATRRKMERQLTGAAARAWRARFSMYASAGLRMAQRIWVGSSYRSVSIDFPRANEYLDTDAILVLRTAYELYKRDDLLSDLVAHFRRQADAASGPAEANYPRLALSSILWWSDSKEEAIAELTKVVEASRPESDLRLDLAELIEQQADYAGALAMLDAVQPLDNLSLRRREELALRVAVRTGNIDRARQAAERLFGLRLDTDTQIALSAQMHQLGLHELAEALLGRARRRAGNKASALVGLMLQYQRQDKLDQAVQVAMQVLRSTPAAPNSSQVRTILTMAEDPAARAFGGHQRSGPFRTPGPAHRPGQRGAEEDPERRPDPPGAGRLLHRRAAARQGARRADQGRRAAARRRQPAAPGRQPTGAGGPGRGGRRALQGCAQEGPVAARPRRAQPGRRRLPQGRQARRPARAPGGGRRLHRLQPLHDGRADPGAHGRRTRPRPGHGGLPQVLEGLPHLSHAVIDLHHAGRDLADARDVRRDPGYDPQRRPHLDHRVRAVVSLPQFEGVVIGGQVQSASSTRGPRPRHRRARGRLDELARDIAAARKDRPDWTVGDFYLAMINCRSGRYDDARALVRKLADPKVKDESLMGSIYPMYAYSALGAELEALPALASEVPALYERAASLPYSMTFLRYGLDQHPAGRLIRLYERQGRMEDCAGVALDLAHQQVPSATVEELARQVRVFALGEMAKRLVELGYPSDAVPLYSEAIALADQIGPDAPSYFANVQQLPRQLREGLESVLGGLNPDDLGGDRRPIDRRCIGRTDRPG